VYFLSGMMVSSSCCDHDQSLNHRHRRSIRLRKIDLGRMLARELGLLYIDTGSMYRAVALAVIESTMNEHDDVAVGDLAERIEIDLGGDPDSSARVLGRPRRERAHTRRRRDADFVDCLDDPGRPPGDG
jgi:hypothetical protein